MKTLEAVWDTKISELDLMGMSFMKDYKLVKMNKESIEINADPHKGLIINERNHKDLIHFMDVVGREKTLIVDSSVHIHNYGNEVLDLENLRIEGGKGYKIFVEGYRNEREFRNLNLVSHNEVVFEKRPDLIDSTIECKTLYAEDLERLPIFRGKTEIRMNGSVILDVRYDRGRTFTRGVREECDAQTFDALIKNTAEEPTFYVSNLITQGIDEVICFDYKKILGCKLIKIILYDEDTSFNLVVDYKNKTLTTAALWASH